MYETKTGDGYEDFSSTKWILAISNYATKPKYCDNSIKLVAGKMKYEKAGVAIEEFFVLKTKL